MADTAASMAGSALGGANQGSRGISYVSSGHLLGRLRYQLPLGAALAALLPALLYHLGDFDSIIRIVGTTYTMVATFIAFSIALFLFRRVISFPGVGIAGHVLPAVTGGYGIVLAVLLGLRLSYSGAQLALSFGMCTLFLFAVSVALRSIRGRRFYVVPSPGLGSFPNRGLFEWVTLTKPVIPDDPNIVLIADLRADLDPEWEKLIADTALAGHPVYHLKQVMESLTGRVEIEHLSENSFGSLIPNLSYRKIKRLIDLVSAAVAIPLLALPGLLVALLIKLDSPGTVFFRQERRGYRGEIFKVLKFRTMTDRVVAPGSEREDAITTSGDARITRLGRFLRRTRIDELPQVWNVLKGEMSWIGPRPEALSLSDWYAGELPFYSYRHIVRPGITGWAQVNQGHVADLEAVFEKLHYDFYYIKNFSAWLDLLITWRTITTIFSGFGAR